MALYETNGIPRMETAKELQKRLKKKKMHFNFENPASEVEAIRDRQRLKKPVRRSFSRLDMYRSEIIELLIAGASITEVHDYLENGGVEISRSAVSRWVKKNVDEEELKKESPHAK